MKKFTFLTIACCFMLLSCMNDRTDQERKSLRTMQIRPLKQDISPPLREMKAYIPGKDEIQVWNEKEKERLYPNMKKAQPQGPDKYWQKEFGTSGPVEFIRSNWDGISKLPGCGWPPDCNGAAGTNYYVQVVNSAFQVFDKKGNSVYGPIYTNTIWQGLPGASNLGPDPFILWDDQAKRWFIAHMGTGGNYLLMAVSVTDDPTGSWYRYSWSWPALPDYPKFSIWRDGYYCSLQCSSWDLGVFNRTAMLAGGSVDGWLVDDPIAKSSGGLAPVDNDGKWAPSGSPGLFITLNDDAWGGNDELWLYTMKVKWGDNGSIAFDRTQKISVGSFDSNFGSFRDNIAQKGTTQKIDAIPMVIMNRAQYRNFDTYQSIVCCHTVDVDNTDHAGIRWYELRKTTGDWSVYQQGTYAPDENSRFMGSIAQNKYGDIAIGYSVSGTNKYPSIAYTGRKTSDLLGTMTIAEKYIWQGKFS